MFISDGTLYMSAGAMGGSPTSFLNGKDVLISDGGAMSTLSKLGDNTISMPPAQ